MGAKYILPLNIYSYLNHRNQAIKKSFKNVCRDFNETISTISILTSNIDISIDTARYRLKDSHTPLSNV